MHYDSDDSMRSFHLTRLIRHPPSERLAVNFKKALSLITIVIFALSGVFSIGVPGTA